MTRIDRILLYTIMGGAPPLLLMLIAWRLGLEYLPSQYHTMAGIAGFVSGIIADMIILPEFVNRAFTLPFYSMILLYGIYLFFFWIVNYRLPWQAIVPGLGAGWYVGGKASYMGGDNLLLKRLARKANTICFIGTFAIFLGSLAIALEDKSETPRWIERINLQDGPKVWITIAFIILVAIVTLIIQWVSIRGTAIIAYRFGMQSKN